jgi:hypothetical protein
MKYHLITLVFLLGALVCYALTYGAGIGMFFGAAFLFEMVFWGRLSRARRRRVTSV